MSGSRAGPQTEAHRRGVRLGGLGGRACKPLSRAALVRVKTLAGGLPQHAGDPPALQAGCENPGWRQQGLRPQYCGAAASLAGEISPHKNPKLQPEPETVNEPQPHHNPPRPGRVEMAAQCQSQRRGQFLQWGFEICSSRCVLNPRRSR